MEIVYTRRARPLVNWEKMVGKWRKSGLSKAAFCRLHDLNYASFNNWVPQFPEPEKPKASFVGIPISPSQDSCENPIYIRCGKLEVEIPSDLPAMRIAEIARELQKVAPCCQE